MNEEQQTQPSGMAGAEETAPQENTAAVTEDTAQDQGGPTVVSGSTEQEAAGSAIDSPTDDVVDESSNITAMPQDDMSAGAPGMGDSGAGEAVAGGDDLEAAADAGSTGDSTTLSQPDSSEGELSAGDTPGSDGSASADSMEGELSAGDTPGMDDSASAAQPDSSGDSPALSQPDSTEGEASSGDAGDAVESGGSAEAAPAPFRREMGQRGGRDGGDFRSQRGPGSQGGEQEGGEEEEMVIRIARDPKLDSVAANASMEDLMKASETQYHTLKHGEVIEGSVMRVDRDEVLVDIGAKTEGIIPNRELQSLTPEEREAMQPGDKVLVSIVQPENAEGHAVLSLDRARQERSWRELQKKFEASEVIHAQVTGHNKGGLLVNIDGVRGFVPSSQISSLPPGEANKQAELGRYHSQTLPLKVIEIHRGRNRLILSERQAMQEQRESMRALLLKELEPGQVRPGTVTSIADFGAFVDIGGADGLIHLSELSWKRVAHPREVLKEGDRIEVYVLNVDPTERKIALSLKRTQPEPWTTITENYTLGQVVHGTITQLTSFGAFARLEDGIEGLIHVSELAEGRVAHPRNVVKEGDVVDLKVIRIDPVKRRIGLSLKRMNEDATAEGGIDGEGAEGHEQDSGSVDVETRQMMQGAVNGEQDQAQGDRDQDRGAGAAVSGQDRIERFERREARAERNQQQQQNRREQSSQGGQGQRQGTGGAAVEDEPMGAFAAALKAHVESSTAADEEEVKTATAAPKAEVTAEQQPEATDELAPADTEEPSAEAAVADAGTPEPAADVPESSMPSAADTDDAELTVDTGGSAPTTVLEEDALDAEPVEASEPDTTAAEEDAPDAEPAEASEPDTTAAEPDAEGVSSAGGSEDSSVDETAGDTPSDDDAGAISGAEGAPSAVEGEESGGVEQVKQEPNQGEG